MNQVNESWVLVFAGSLVSKLNPSNLSMILNQITSRFNLLASQLFDNRYVWGYRHLYSAIWHAQNALKNNRMIAKTLSMEVLLYTAGQRQIKKAIELLGVKETTIDIAGLLLAEKDDQLINANIQLQKELGLKPNLDLLNDFSSKNKYLIEMLVNEGFPAYKFTFTEVENAILQRIALLTLE